jgi:hypothetical protein
MAWKGEDFLVGKAMKKLLAGSDELIKVDE